MRLYFSFSLIFIFFFFSGCSTSPINLNHNDGSLLDESLNKQQEKEILIDNKEISQKKVDNYSVAMDYRRKLWLKGMNYIPWENHLPMDVEFMPKLLQFSSNDVKSYNLGLYKIVATKGKTFLSKKEEVLFLNYKSDLKSIKEFAIKNLKNIKKDKNTNFSKDFNETKNIQKINLNFKSKNIRDENRLKNELNKLYNSEIVRYGLDKYNIIPILSGKIYEDGNNLYIPTTIKYADILVYFQQK
jgi:hypothetical protein